MSGLKKSVFDKLVISMTTLKKETQEDDPKVKQPIKRTRTFLEAVEAKARGVIKVLSTKVKTFITLLILSIAMDEEKGCGDAEPELPQVDFAAWKRRMLEEAKRQ